MAVHVRRNDYLIHPAFQVCDMAYYQESIRKLRDACRTRAFTFSRMIRSGAALSFADGGSGGDRFRQAGVQSAA